MGSAAQAIEASFRQLLAATPYSKITVKEICLAAGVSRRAFYDVFSDKDALVAHIVDRDIMQPQRDINSLFSTEEASEMIATICEKIYRPLLDDRDFYTALIGSPMNPDPIFEKTVTQVIYHFNLERLREIQFGSYEEEADYVAYYFAASRAKLMQKWICDGMRVPVERMANLSVQVSYPFWKELSKEGRKDR